MAFMETLKTMVLEGNLEEAEIRTREALAAGAAPQDIIDRALIPAMAAVGERFAAGDLFVPEMMFSAKTMQESLRVLQPHIVAGSVKPKAVVVFGTVQGDVHDIGKNLVIMMMQGVGFEVHDLGANVAPEAFCDAALERKPDLLCMSALLTTTQGAMGKTLELLRARGLRSSVKVMVGGAVLTDGYAAEIGADAYAPDAGTAVERAKGLLGLP